MSTQILPYLEHALITESDMHDHIDRLMGVVRETNAANVIELGVRKGVSTVAFLAALEETDGRLWSCDRNPHRVGPEIARHPRWSFVLGDDVDPAIARLAPEPCDVLFIDTSHTLEHTWQELALYGPKVRSGGAIVCHDTNDAGVSLPLWIYYQQRGAEFHDYRSSHGLAIVRMT